MMIQDIIRNMLNVIDGIEKPPVAVVVSTEKPGQDSPLTHAGDDINRFKQIVDLADDGDKEFVNSPNEKYADIDAVTTNAGGGVNGPKHPSDMRVQHPSLYPTAQSAEEQPKRLSIHDALMQMLGGK